MVISRNCRCLLVAMAMCTPAAMYTQETGRARTDSAARLGSVNITAERSDASAVSALQRMTLPVGASITSQRAQETINVIDPEDAVKYLPSVFLRKRNNGDTQATMATRVWGTSSSARSLIFADGVPLTAAIANNNTIGGPRWGLVSPDEIRRIDLMYGPFSAAYAGNSMGAVMEITTGMPDRRTGSIQQSGALQSFALYGTRRRLGTAQTNATFGDRLGKLSLWTSANHQESRSQPLAYVTSATFPAGTGGGFAERNKLGATSNVLGATGLLSTTMTGAKVKIAYDLTRDWQATYRFGVWRNDGASAVETYLSNGTTATFANQSGFAINTYDVVQRHSSHALTLRGSRGRDWDFDVAVSRYAFDTDQQRFPIAASTDTFSTAGRVAVLDGTHWMNVDLKAAWHRGGPVSRHVVSFGAHLDAYTLRNSTFDTPEWKAGPLGAVTTQGDGRTRTAALWAQDAWFIRPTLQLTAGARVESWRGYDGYNASGATQVAQPEVSAMRFSPKAIVAWDATPSVKVTASVGKAYRFATAAELYQLVTTGATYTSPDPRLEPDNVLATELRMARAFTRGTAQVAFFQDDVRDAIIAQFLPLVTGSPTLYSYFANVDHVRARGAEVAFGGTDVGVRGIDVSGNVTYVDARTLALSGRASASAPAGSAVGKALPNIPKWRSTLLTTWRATTRLSISGAARYSDKVYTTLDNADNHFNTYQGFSQWLVVDAKANYRFDRHWSASFGVDNLLNRKYFLFHPFPQRTVIAGAKFAF